MGTTAAPASEKNSGGDAIVSESFSIHRNVLRLAPTRQAVCCGLELMAKLVCLMNFARQTYH